MRLILLACLVTLGLTHSSDESHEDHNPKEPKAPDIYRTCQKDQVLRIEQCAPLMFPKASGLGPGGKRRASLRSKIKGQKKAAAELSSDSVDEGKVQANMTTNVTFQDLNMPPPPYPDNASHKGKDNEDKVQQKFSNSGSDDLDVMPPAGEDAPTSPPNTDSDDSIFGKAESAAKDVIEWVIGKGSDEDPPPSSNSSTSKVMLGMDKGSLPPTPSEDEEKDVYWNNLMDSVEEEVAAEEIVALNESHETYDSFDAAVDEEKEKLDAMTPEEKKNIENEIEDTVETVAVVAEEFEEVYEEAQEEIIYDITCEDMDKYYDDFLSCLDTEACGYCSGADPSDVASVNLLLSALGCDLRLCTLPDLGKKPPCTPADIDTITACEDNAGSDTSWLTTSDVCDTLRSIDSCVDGAACDACRYLEVYDAGGVYVEVVNLHEAALGCADRMCGQGQGTNSYRSYAQPASSEGWKSDSGDGDGFNTSVLTLTITATAFVSLSLMYFVTRRRRGRISSSAIRGGRHRPIDCPDELQMDVDGGEGTANMKPMRLGQEAGML